MQLILSKTACLSENTHIYCIYLFIYAQHTHKQNAAEISLYRKSPGGEAGVFPLVQKPLVRMEVIYGLSPCRI